MNDLIEDWKQNAERKSDENFGFLHWLKFHKDPDHVDRIAGESHGEVFSEIDCTDCGNCCRVIRPTFDKSDIERISSHLQISEEEFVETYLQIGEDNEYETKTLPCPFLKENKCGIYDIRPTTCREYPHTDKEGFSSRKYLHSGNAEVCPAVYHILETMKYRFNWRRRR